MVIYIDSSDRSSASFWESLEGATRDSLTGINFDGGLGNDTLIVGSQEYSHSFSAISDDTIQIQGEVHSESVFFKAKDIINQGSIIASNVTAEFSNSYTDEAEAKIIAIDGGNILLNGGKTGDLQATGQFLATGVVGGKIDLRGKTVSLRGANLDASGQNGGGTILIGGDYQGIDPTGLGTLSNAQFTFADKYSSISANAITRGNGGKVIIWSDGDTDFRGNITARGGLEIGDGGFVEVSGKENLNFVGNVDVDATNGKLGSLLLDPADIIINPDDGNKNTFDISDLQKIKGNVTLSATNDIIFIAAGDFSIPVGTITLKAGNSVILTQKFDTGGRALNISGAFINAMDRISSNSLSSGKSGNIKLTSRGGIDLGEVSAYSDQGDAGSITLEASIFINAGELAAYVSGNGNGGNVRLSASGDIYTSGIFTYSDGSGSGGKVNILGSSDSLSSIAVGRINTSGNGNGGDVRLSANDSISTSDIFTYSNGGGNGGNVNILGGASTLSSRSITVGQINTSGNGNGGDVRLSASADISTSDIFTYSNGGGNGGNVNILGGASTLGSVFTYAGANVGNGGAVTINAESISMNGINTSANSGFGGKVTLKANQDITLGSIVSNSVVNNAGAIQVVSSEGSINVVKKYNYFTGLVSANSKQGNGANINLTAKQLITTGLIDSGADGDGNGGNIKLSTYGDILTSTIVTNSNGKGKSGNISLVSFNGNIKTTNDSPDTDARYIYAGAVGGNAGSVTLKAFGDIESGSITTSSQYGEGGSVNIEAGGESIKIVNSLSRNGNEYSIYSAGANKNGKINIQQTGKTDNYFEVGDATYNGTKGGIYAGVNANGVENNLLGTTIVVGTYIDGNIKIVTPDSGTGLTKAKQLAAEKPTSPTTFAPVSVSQIQGFIDNGNSALSSIAAQREYRKAIVALDNFRTLEFYQSQGNTSPPVPQLNSVSQIKSFLYAGDIATGTKSAMIYTFLSGTTQDNLSGTSLNLFAVTSTSDVIYKTIPLINGQYQGFSVEYTANDFRAGVRDLSSDDYKDPASRLYDLIFRPLKDALSLSQVNNLIFSNDNLFRTIPLAALYDKQTSKFLVEDFSSSVTPSFQVIEKDRYTSLKSANVLKMGATVFGSSTPLPSVRTELENIAQIELQNSPSMRHSPIYLNDQFSSSNLKTLIAKNDAPIVHFSTHGVASNNSESFILLGSNSSSGQSDRLNASDIRQLKDLSNKDLLVFSTCLSFTGFDYGTAGATLVAGVKSVIGCGWIVSDSGTMVAMTSFYQQLLGNGLSKTKALQKAQKSMILGNVKLTDVVGTTDRSELSINGIKVISSEYGQKDIKSKLVDKDDPNLNRLKHPFYWAAFSLVGNPW